MLDFLNLEKQAGRRIKGFLLHKATEENIDASSAKLVITIPNGNVSVHLFSNNKRTRELSLESIAAFFGKEYDHAKAGLVYNYLVKRSEKEKIEIAKLNVVICEHKGDMGAHLYNENKYVRRIPTLELLNKFYFPS